MEKDCYFPRKIVPIVFLALFSYFNGGGAKYDVRLLSALGLIFGAIGDYLIGNFLLNLKYRKMMILKHKAINMIVSWFHEFFLLFFRNRSWRPRICSCIVRHRSHTLHGKILDSHPSINNHRWTELNEKRSSWQYFETLLLSKISS